VVGVSELHLKGIILSRVDEDNGSPGSNREPVT